MIASTPPAPLNPPIAITARVKGLSSDMRGGSIVATIRCGDDRCRALRIHTIDGITTLSPPNIVVRWFEGFENDDCTAMLLGTSEIPIAAPLPLPPWKNAFQGGSPARYGLNEGKQITIHLTNIDPIVCRPARSRRY